MKKVVAIIRAVKFEDVREALAEAGVNFFTYYEVRGFGLQKGEVKKYRGAVYDMGYIARYKLEILLPEEKVETAINTILSVGKTGDIGDGKIYVEALEDVIRIRTGETGKDAV
jgi:nitrogen regulatory protein PII